LKALRVEVNLQSPKSRQNADDIMKTVEKVIAK
jgi:hypothetical protein